VQVQTNQERKDKNKRLLDSTSGRIICAIQERMLSEESGREVFFDFIPFGLDEKEFLTALCDKYREFGRLLRKKKKE
jgi:hypothetical protein